MIRPYQREDFETALSVINDAAQAYKGVIPEDRWHEPYMTADHLRGEIKDRVRFFLCVEEGGILGVMGIQHVQDVTLIRHAYVRTMDRGKGIGGKLLHHLAGQTTRPLLVGTWAAAEWAIRFYEKHGFKMTSREEKDRLLRKYWNIPERQIETSVVLAQGKGSGQGG
jgi:GNAT superfamily N-acetyltransferase